MKQFIAFSLLNLVVSSVCVRKKNVKKKVPSASAIITAKIGPTTGQSTVTIILPSMVSYFGAAKEQAG